MMYVLCEDCEVQQHRRLDTGVKTGKTLYTLHSSLSKMKLQNIINIVLIFFGTILAGIPITLTTSFYPKEALTRGISVGLTGAAFGSVFFFSAIWSLICVKYFQRRVLKCFLAGIYTTGEIRTLGVVKLGF